MVDEQIVALYWQRDEAAIHETQQKYGRYLLKIAHNILMDMEDSRESVNDTYLKAWGSMPPQAPNVLSTYLGKLTRRTSIDRLRTRSRQKRCASEYTLSLDELAECLPGGCETDQAVDAAMLAEAIGAYLRTLPAEARIAFVCRYYFADPLKEVAAHLGMGESKAKSLLYRARQGLRAHLEQEGFDL